MKQSDKTMPWPLMGKPTLHTYQAGISVQHFQLRNLVMPWKDAGGGYEVVYPSSGQLRSISLDSGINHELVATDSIPRCLRVFGDIVGYAGICEYGYDVDKGCFSLFNRETKSKYTTTAGDKLNNSLLLWDNLTGPARDGGQPAGSEYCSTPTALRSVLCNNDEHAYIGDISGFNWRTINRIDIGMPINQAAITRDTKTLAFCGDSPLLKLYHPEEPFRGWRAGNTAGHYGDMGMAIDISPSGRLMAASFQCGVCEVYDLRHLHKPVASIESTRRAKIDDVKELASKRDGIFWTVQFSDTQHELLFTAEQNGRVHIANPSVSAHEVWQLPDATERYPSLSDVTGPDSRPNLVSPGTGHPAEPSRPFGAKLACRKEQDVRGLAWCGWKGGSLIVGSSNGISALNIPQRKGIPLFELH